MAKLNDRIKYVKKVLGTPYHFWMEFKDTANPRMQLVKIHFEDKDGKIYSFSGTTMVNAVNDAKKYVNNEIKMGTLKEPIVKKNAGK